MCSLSLITKPSPPYRYLAVSASLIYLVIQLAALIQLIIKITILPDPLTLGAGAVLLISIFGLLLAYLQPLEWWLENNAHPCYITSSSTRQSLVQVLRYKLLESDREGLLNLISTIISLILLFLGILITFFITPTLLGLITLIGLVCLTAIFYGVAIPRWYTLWLRAQMALTYYRCTEQRLSEESYPVQVLQLWGEADKAVTRGDWYRITDIFQQMWNALDARLQQLLRYLVTPDSPGPHPPQPVSETRSVPVLRHILSWNIADNFSSALGEAKNLLDYSWFHGMKISYWFSALGITGNSFKNLQERILARQPTIDWRINPSSVAMVTEEFWISEVAKEQAASLPAEAFREYISRPSNQVLVLERGAAELINLFLLAETVRQKLKELRNFIKATRCRFAFRIHTLPPETSETPNPWSDSDKYYMKTPQGDLLYWWNSTDDEPPQINVLCLDNGVKIELLTIQESDDTVSLHSTILRDSSNT